MGFRVRMSGEIHDWLTDLRDSDRPAAMIAGQALTALAIEGDALGPPLLISPDGQVPPANLADALDQAYQDRLEALNMLRRRAADAAWVRKEHAIEQAWVQYGDDGGTEDDQAGPPVTGTVARLDEILRWIERELGGQGAAEGLMELRPGAPGDSKIRILFAVEPPGTALLIAVIEGHEAVRDHYREAVGLAFAALRQARAGQAPEMAAHTFGSAQSFIQAFFPDHLDEVRAGATVLVAKNRGTA